MTATRTSPRRRPLWVAGTLLGAALFGSVAVGADAPATEPATQPATRPTSRPSRQTAARITAAKVDLASLNVALSAYEIDTGAFPTAEQGLKALAEQPAGVMSWRGPYVRKMPNDPWDRPYRYVFPSKREGAAFDLSSDGPDGEAGTDDDVVWTDEK